MIWTMLEEFPGLKQYAFRSGEILIQLDMKNIKNSLKYDLNESSPNPTTVDPSHIEEIFSQFPEIML